MACADTLDVGKEQAEVYYVYIPLLWLYSLLYIYDFIYCILELVSPHTRLYIWPAFCLYCLCWQPLGALHEQPGVRCGRDILAGAGFGARSRLVDMYIYQLCIFITRQTYMLLWDMYYLILLSTLVYWLCIICFRIALSHMYKPSYLFRSCIFWLLYIIPALWDWSLFPAS